MSISGGTFLARRRAGGATTAGTSITASYNAATGVLTLTGTDTLAHYQQVLDSVTLRHRPATTRPTSAPTPSRTITWVVNDGTLNSSATADHDVSITAANDAPVLSDVAATASYTEHGAPATLSSGGLTVSDSDSLTLASATVSITGGTSRSTATCWRRRRRGTSITASYNAATGMLSLTGNDTLAHYQQVLDSVTLLSTQRQPDQLRRRRQPDDHLAGQRRHAQQRARATTTMSITAVERRAGARRRGGECVAITEQAAAVTLSPTRDGDATPTTRPGRGDGVDHRRHFAATATCWRRRRAGTSITASYNAATGMLT